MPYTFCFFGKICPFLCLLLRYQYLSFDYQFANIFASKTHAHHKYLQKKSYFCIYDEIVCNFCNVHNNLMAWLKFICCITNSGFKDRKRFSWNVEITQWRNLLFCFNWSASVHFHNEWRHCKFNAFTNSSEIPVFVFFISAYNITWITIEGRLMQIWKFPYIPVFI